ncbi:MAG: peroxiredoxin-like family protein [Planctomycetota bacterium]
MQLRGLDEVLERARTPMVFVGTGSPAMARNFSAQRAGPHAVLSDRDRKTFAAAGMRRGLGAVLHWRTVQNLIRALRRGFRQARILGDPWQQGGVLVFDGKGVIVHRQIDRVGGEPIDLARVRLAIGA